MPPTFAQTSSPNLSFSDPFPALNTFVKNSRIAFGWVHLDALQYDFKIKDVSTTEAHRREAREARLDLVLILLIIRGYTVLLAPHDTLYISLMLSLRSTPERSYSGVELE